jgi:CheY-like chemotaxis protein
LVSRVLVVDDEPQIRRTLAINLRAWGYQVDLAATGEEALKAAADQPPDVVVLDLSLPGIDGLQVIQGLRGWTRVPIIVLSVREREADKVAALDAGADDYVTKPFGITSCWLACGPPSAGPPQPTSRSLSYRPRTSALTWPPSRSPGTAGRSG